ncbi:hypothetical protein BURMUCGD1_3954 [Burkholderia multivorans CGD1]|nr:hypothetical protein BURMUCGD1_3954 [Burkholderia multivorans CGD1]
MPTAMRLRSGRRYACADVPLRAQRAARHARLFHACIVGTG